MSFFSKFMLVSGTLYVSVTITYAQCPKKNFPNDSLESTAVYLDRQRPALKDVRAYVSDDKSSSHLSETQRAQISTTTHRLEYWSKDLARYIRQYGKSSPDKVCERIYVGDLQYLIDFAFLTNPAFVHWPEGSKVRFEDYK